MREVAKGAVIAFALKVIGTGMMFAFNVILARSLGAEGTGVFFLALSVVAIASVLTRLGLDNALLRHVASHASKKDWVKIQEFYALGIRMTISVSIVVTLIIFFFSEWFAVYLFHKPELSEVLRWMSLSILPFALLNLQAESLKGIKHIRDAMVVQGIILPLVALLLVIPLIAWQGTLGAAQAYMVGAIISMVLGSWFWRRSTPHVQYTAQLSIWDIWSKSKHLYLVSIVNTAIIPWAPLLLLGLWASNEDVGVFAAANRVSVLISFLLMAANSVLAPKFAELYAQGDILGLEGLARRSAFLITVLSMPILLLFFFQGAWVMSIFGAGFENGGMILIVLSIGQLVNILCGSVGYILDMSGNSKVNSAITVVSGLFLLMLAAVFIPIYGAIGAALAASSGLIIFNILALVAVRRKLSIKVSAL